jgi:hypothetical protein
MVESVPAEKDQLPDSRDTASRFQQVMGRQGFDPWTALSNLIGNAAAAPFQNTRRPAGATFDAEDSSPLNMPPSARPPQPRPSAAEARLPVSSGIPSWTERQQQLAQGRADAARAAAERQMTAARELASKLNITPEQLFSTLGITAPNINFGAETFRQTPQANIPTPPAYVPPTPDQLRRMDAARTTRPQQAAAPGAARQAAQPVYVPQQRNMSEMLAEMLASDRSYAAQRAAPRAPASRPGPGLILDPMMGGGNA